MMIGKKYTRSRKPKPPPIIIPIIDPNRQKEVEPRPGCGWPVGVRFEDAEHVERSVIHRVVPHAPEQRSLTGNSAVMCTQSARW